MWRVWISVCLFLLTGMAHCADPPKPAPPKPVLPTLADALKTCRPPRTGVVLVVGAENIALPPKTDAPYAQADIYTVAGVYGRLVQTFGTVTALAPPTMTLLNTHPARPDVYADLRPLSVFQMLAASLSDAQWAALTSEQGIGLTDLTTDDQRDLFHALFPQGQLRVATQDPELVRLDDDKRPDVQDVSGQIDTARLRLGQTTHLYLHDAQGEMIIVSDPRPDAASPLTVFTGKSVPKPAAHGVALRADVPNAPKSGDLNFSLPVLQTAITLDKMPTVGDLIDRIRAQTGVEIYADPHYAGKTLTVLGPATSAPAAQLLQSVALCVCGTFRKVGPALVLTDDVQGVGARRLLLSQWEEVANAARNRVSGPSGQMLLARRASTLRALPGFGDTLAMTPAQMQAAPPDSLLPELPTDFDYAVPFQDLTPAQQEQARKMKADFLADRAARPDVADARVPDLSGKVDIREVPVVQLLLPTLPAPVSTSFAFYSLTMLCYPGDAFLNSRLVKLAKRATAVKPDPKHAPPPLAPLLKVGKRRALFARPRTAADVDSLLPAMRKLGLNELHLDVFSDGQAHVPGFALSPPAPIAGNDILTEALAQGPKYGIAVYADLSLLLWGDAPPAGCADLTLLGETTAEAAARAHERDPSPQFDDETGLPIDFVLPPVAVSPLSPVVENDLTALVRSLAGRPGLAGFVWEDADMDDDLGFTPAQRLVFLRLAHADPADITPSGQNVRFDVSLPEWDNDGIDNALAGTWDTPGRWETARRDLHAALLRRLRLLVPPALPILMEQSAGGTDWLASWDNPRQMPPPLRDLFRNEAYPRPGEAQAAARNQGRIVLLRVPADSPDRLAFLLKDGQQGAHWDGFVLECDDATRGPAPLSDLLAAARAPKP